MENPSNQLISDKPLIIAIETSCDETAISILEDLHVISHGVHSQADLHAQYGGVFPTLAKREHARNLTPLLAQTIETFLKQTDIFSDTNCIENDSNRGESQLGESDLRKSKLGDESVYIPTETIEYIESLLAREEGLSASLIDYISKLNAGHFAYIKEKLRGIAVTYGPGLEPALWVGLSFAKALSAILDVPLFPINHMEGHIASVITDTINIKDPEYATSNRLDAIDFPAIALLISGGHTELVEIGSWHEYDVIGHTVDDAVGEAYDKAARVLGLPYPGGPEISKLASIYRESEKRAVDEMPVFTLPRPMLHSQDFNFSFSGLKTAVLYAVRDFKAVHENRELCDLEKQALAAEFEEAVREVLIKKTSKAIDAIGAKTLIIGGGVISNTYLRKKFTELSEKLNINLFIPEKNLTTDNATMIGLVAVLKILAGENGIMPHSPIFNDLKAQGNLSL